MSGFYRLQRLMRAGPRECFKNRPSDVESAFLDPSAARWLDFVDMPGTSDHDFHFISDVGSQATPTYASLFNIDHIMADTASGSCWSAGVDGTSAVQEAVYFDHMPLVCELTIE